MAAHSATSPVVPSVLPDQPATGWGAWLRQIAQSLNLLGAWATSETAARVAADNALAPVFGAWVPFDASGAGLTFTVVEDCYYQKIGRLMVAQGRIGYPITASGLGAQIGGLPAVALAGINSEAGGFFGYAPAAGLSPLVKAGDTFFLIFNATTQVSNANLSGTEIRFTLVYLTT